MGEINLGSSELRGFPPRRAEGHPDRGKIHHTQPNSDFIPKTTKIVPSPRLADKGVYPNLSRHHRLQLFGG